MLHQTTEKPSNRDGLSESDTGNPSDSLTKEPPVLQLKKARKNKVVIVGAGISGLRAASVLERHGLEVQVLEGRDRIGGRIHTTRTEAGVPRDIDLCGSVDGRKASLPPGNICFLFADSYMSTVGAAWLHETSQNRLTKLISSLKLDYYYDDGAPLYYTSEGRAGAQFKASRVADEAVCNAEWYYETFPDAADTSVTNYVNAFVQKHELISDIDRRWAPMAVKEVELWIGTSCDLASAKHLSYFVAERNLYMKGGYDNIVKWTAQSLGQDIIRLNSVVDRITWGSDGATLDYHDVEGTRCSVQADAVISTLPLGVLRQELVTFDPPLPIDMQLAIASFGYGALGKVFFEFDDVFWSKDNDQFVFYPSPPELEEDMYSTSASSGSSGTIEVDSILNYATVTINLWIITGSKELCVQIAEPLTQRIEAMTDKKAIYKFFEPLFRLLRTEPYKALPRLLNVETTKWTQDPLAGFGSYSADKVGDEPGLLMNSLEKHKGSRLQFAGEHCTMVANGCVHGAFATGETAARNILKIFEIDYDGGDLVSIK